MDDVAEELRSCKAPAASCHVAVELPKPLAGGDEQSDRTAPRGLELRHVILRFGGPAKLRLHQALDKIRVATLDAAEIHAPRRGRFSATINDPVARVDRRAASQLSTKEPPMTIKVGDRLPAGTLSEYVDVETPGCTIGPNQFQVEDLTN